MSFEVEIYADLRLIAWRFSGVFHPAEFHEATAQLMRDPCFDPSFHLISQFDPACQLHTMNREALVDLREVVHARNVRVRRATHVRSALVFTAEAQRPTLELWATIAAAGTPMGVEYKLFQATSDALAWLNLPTSAVARLGPV